MLRKLSLSLYQETVRDMITKETFANYIKQYKNLNDLDFSKEADVFTLANHLFNQGFEYGRKKKPVQKFDNYGRSGKRLGF